MSFNDILLNASPEDFADGAKTLATMILRYADEGQSFSELAIETSKWILTLSYDELIEHKKVLDKRRAAKAAE